MAVREIKAEKVKNSRLLKIALLCLVIYFAYVLVSQQMEIGEKRQQLATLNSQIQVQEVRNNELRHDMEGSGAGSDEYIENAARSEFNYARYGERVFVNIAGE